MTRQGIIPLAQVVFTTPVAMLLLTITVMASSVVSGSTPSASFTSDVQIVMSWDRDNCGTVNNTPVPPMPTPQCGVTSSSESGCDLDNIDSMPRVWFDKSSGLYRQLHSVALAQGPSRPQVGASLTTLKHTCQPYVAMQQQDYVLKDFNDRVWVEAPYVLNETHVYALTHVDSYNRSLKVVHKNVYSSLTLQVSTDGGASFAQAFPAPFHLVGTSPYKNGDGSFGHGLGLGMPSSIVKDPKSDYLYVMALANWGHDIAAQAGGQCLLRTNDITDPGSWRAWNGTGFTVSVNASAEVAPVLDPDAHTCAVLDLPLTHISLLWSSFYEQFLAFGGIGGGWGFALSDDLITWSDVSKLEAQAFKWDAGGNATITPVSPMPGRWVFEPGNPFPGKPYWVGASNATGEAAASGKVYKWPASCKGCHFGPCELCPGMGDVCKLAKPMSTAEWSVIPSTNPHVQFSCGLVNKLAGYTGYLYATLVDDSEHQRTGSDPSLNVVGQNATVFFVARTCVGTKPPWKPGSALECTEKDAAHVLKRDVARASIKFDTISARKLRETKDERKQA